MKQIRSQETPEIEKSTIAKHTTIDNKDTLLYTHSTTVWSSLHVFWHHNVVSDCLLFPSNFLAIISFPVS
jgi:hypothetical protein